jgi:YVTN family beta-propeller protein
MIDYRILGPLEVSADGRVIEVGGPKLRALLAILLLRANESVPRDVLVHELWGGQPPAGAQGSLDVYVSRLRRALGAAANGPVVVTRPGAYCLRLADGQLDVRRFERLVARGRSALAANTPDQAGASLRAALQLWRGNALSDLSCEPFAQVEIGRLEELRLGAVEDRIESDLALGRHADVVSELEALVAVHPLRERPHGQLMIALYRCGRQAEALEAFQTARRTLVEELALEPGPALQRLELAILRHDPSLELSGRAEAAPPPADQVARPPKVHADDYPDGHADCHPDGHADCRPDAHADGHPHTHADGHPHTHADGHPDGHAARAHPRRARVAPIALAVAAVLAAGLLLGFSAARRAEATLAGANGLVDVSTGSGQLAAATPLTGAPEGVSGGANSVWAADPDGGAVTRIDPGSGAAQDQILMNGEPGSIVSGGGAIWAASTVGATVVRIDPVTESVTQTIPLPGSNLGTIAFGAGRLWVADPATDELFDIDPATGSLQRTLSLDLQPSALAVADGALWVAGYNDATVERLAPASGRMTGRVHVGDGPVALAFEAGSLWVANSLDATVSKVDPVTLTVRATVPVGSGPSALAAGQGSL